MQVIFLRSVTGQDYSFQRGDIIDSAKRPEDQIKRWLSRCVVREWIEPCRFPDKPDKAPK